MIESACLTAAILAEILRSFPPESPVVVTLTGQSHDPAVGRVFVVDVDHVGEITTGTGTTVATIEIAPSSAVSLLRKCHVDAEP
jgi:hypothetical protein